MTGDAGHAAAQNQRTTLASIIPNLVTGTGQAYDSAGNILKAGYGQAKGDLALGYDAAGNAIRTGAGGALDFLDAGTGGALGKLDAAKGTLTTGGGAFTPLSDLAGRYRQGADLYGDALGIHGPDGNTRATASFQTGPGYEFTRNEGIEALARKANASGQLVGGNADRDAMTFATGLADKTYGSWLDRLKDFNPLELSATSGAATGNAGVNRDVAGIDITGAGLLDAAGQRKAGVSQTSGNSLAALADAYYRSHGGLATGEAGAVSGNLLAGNRDQNALFLGAIPQWNDTYKQDAKASTDASGNTINLGMNLAKLAASAAGGAGGGGSSFMPSSAFMSNNWGW